MKQGTIKFDRNVKVLGESAFEGLSTLTSITIPKSVQIIENNAFKGCSNIEKIIYKGTSDNWYNISIEEFYDTSIAGKTVSCIDDNIIIPNYLTFTALEDGEIGFYVNPDASIQPTIEYSYNKQNWNTLTEEYVSVPSGSNLYCRGVNTNGISPGYYEGIHNYFISTGQFNVSGDIMSLIDYKHSVKEMVGTMMYMFGRDEGDYVDIVDASNLILSAEILTSDCYQNMFESCINMVYPPQIKATTLAPYCCRAMFYNCSSLEYAPELPVTTLVESCYEVMFYNCSSLTQAPELPATTLAKDCYFDMFHCCTSLVTAPELPATKLADWCYDSMFKGCTSLTTAPELPATTLTDHCYGDMFSGCTSLTIAPELPATTLAPYCYSYMFDGCTSLATAPELPATELTEDCYSSMFSGCTSLTTAPELPATTLANYCYGHMFYNCTSLNHIKCLATDISATNCTNNWVNRVAETGTFIKHPDMNGWEIDSVNGIPTGWVVEDCIDYLTFTAEESGSTLGLEQLSTNQTLKYSYDKSIWTNMDTSTTITLANVDDEVYIKGMLSADNTYNNYTQFKMTGKIAARGNCNAIWNYQDLNASLKNYCGCNMFSGCTSLTSAPELPATTLAYGCYYYMFQNCNSLTISPELPATKLVTRCYEDMFHDCSSLVTAPELPATTLTEDCYNGMFLGCTSLATAPELPATELAKGCYTSMFQDCSSLTAAPELPATTLAEDCYSNMFAYCTLLTTAPELPAAELAKDCYSLMFSGCTSLTTAPELPATELAERCYYVMFQGCTNLNYIKCLATNISATDCTTRWVSSNVPSTGTFVKHPDMNDWEIDSVNGIPTGWTVVNNGEIPAPDPEEPENPEEPETTAYVIFKAEEDNSSIGLEKLSTNQTLEYSTDTTTWNTFDTTTNISLNNGDKVYVRGILRTDNTDSNYTQFEMSGKIAASGNCNAIWNYQDLNAPLKKYCGCSMFHNCYSLVATPELLATELAEGCYWNMFGNCSSLVTVPVLPATTLAKDCYIGMFSACKSLTTAPELPATGLTDGCYHSMFDGCTSLNEIKCLATDISATDCTSNWVDSVAETGTFIKHPDMNDWVVDSVNGIPTGWIVVDNGETPTPDPEEPENPEEPETTAYVTFKAEEDNSTIGLENLGIYQTLEYSTDTTTWNTFDTTTNISLNNGDKVYIRGILSNDLTITDREGGGISYTGTHVTNFKMTGKIAASGNCNAIWNYQDLNAPLKIGCGLCLFENCTSLTTAPELPATTLAEYCYHGMFRGCTSLTIAPELPATTLAKYCYFGIFTNCTSLTTAPELPATELVKSCYQAMFSSCTSLTTASELPATILAESCYSNMFRECTSLTTAPELPATTLADKCYQQMFNDCSSLNEIKCLATDRSASSCTSSWVNGVAETGTFIKHPNMTSWPTGTAGVNGIPNGWTVVDAEIA